MTRPIIRSLVWATPAVLSYLGVAPLLACAVDRHFGFNWPLPVWIWRLAPTLTLAGSAIVLWAAWLFSTRGQGTPNPLSPPQNLVLDGPYRYTRNPIMLGGWLAGFSLALFLRSPSLLVAYFLIVVTGYIYVRAIEEPRLLDRFGDSYREYMRSVPRWLVICLALLGTRSLC